MSATSRLLMTLVALLIGVGMLDLPDRWASPASVNCGAELVKQTVSNCKRLRERRVVFSFGVTY